MRWGFPKGSLVVKLSALKVRFGKVVLARRLRAEIGQDEFAEKAGMHRTTLSALERGKHLPNLAMIQKLAKAFGVDMATLVAEAEDEETPLNEPPSLPKGRPRKGVVTEARPKGRRK